MNEQNKKDDTIIKNGVIKIDAESIVFAKGAFRLVTINKTLILRQTRNRAYRTIWVIN